MNRIKRDSERLAPYGTNVVITAIIVNDDDEDEEEEEDDDVAVDDGSNFGAHYGTWCVCVWGTGDATEGYTCTNCNQSGFPVGSCSHWTCCRKFNEVDKVCKRNLGEGNGVKGHTKWV